MTNSTAACTLRPATSEDAPMITDLMHRAFLEYDGVLDPPSGTHKESVESVRHKMETGQWVLAEQEGNPVGCVWYEPHAEYVYLGRLSVPPEYRGQGIAWRLVDYVEMLVRVNYAPRVRLGVRLALPKMQAAYERRGYRVLAFESHAGYSEPTFVTMEKVVG